MTAVKPHRAPHADGSPSNWQLYLDLLQQRGVPETAQRWNDKPLETLDAEDVHGL